jgi:protein ImuB
MSLQASQSSRAARIAAIAIFGNSTVSESDNTKSEPPSPEFMREMQVRIAELGFAFGPTTSFEDNSHEHEHENVPVVWIDVTGCGHLYRTNSSLEGERLLAMRLTEQVNALGVDVRVAIADGPLVAAAVARHYPVRASRGSAPSRTGPRRPVVVPPGKNREALRPLPLDALPVTEETRRFLTHVGMRTLGDLQRLPRSSLGVRLGADAARIMPFLDGDDRTPLRPYVPPEVPEERAELEYGITAHEALLFVAKTLCDRMGPRLLGRALGAARLELVFALDRGLVPEGEEPRATAEIALPAPLQRAADLFAVLRTRLESQVLNAPALAVTLRVPELVRMECRARDLFIPEAKAYLALPRLTAELIAELGEESVGVLTLEDTWDFFERSRLVPYGSSHSRRKFKALSGAPEPTRILAQPRPLARTDVRSLSLVMRLESVQWWKAHAVFASIYDYGTAWIDGTGLAWIQIDRITGEISLCGWMD